jgi:hypothetical protein
MRRFIYSALVVVLLSGCLDDEITSEALDKGDPSLCLAHEKDIDVDFCVRSVAKKTGDEKVCDEYFKDDIKNRADCYADIGGETGKLELCDQSGRISGHTEVKWDCYKDAGVKKEDPDICAKISDPEKKSECYGTLGQKMNRIDLCQEASKAKKGNYMADGCFKTLAEKSNDPTLCKNIEYEPSRDLCYLNIAVKTKNPNACLGMSEEYGHYCTGRVTGNPEECEYAGRHKDLCLADSAETSGNSQVCEKLEGYLKEQCYEGVVRTTGDESLCEKIPNRRDACLMNAARASKDAGICEMVAPTSRNQCITDVAISSGDAMVCSSIENHADEEDCEKRVMRSATTTTVPSGEKADDVAAGFIRDIIGF